MLEVRNPLSAMSNRKTQSRLATLAELDRAVIDAAAFFADADESLADEHQTACEVLSHLVFWHREYVRIVCALAAGDKPRLRAGKFRELNAQATRKFKRASLPRLSAQLAELQARLERMLCALPDWRIDFPVKDGGKHTRVAARVPQIAAHIRNHVARLRRVAKSKTRGVSKTLRV